MKKPTIYVEFEKTSKLGQVLRQVAFGAEPVEKLVDEHDVEADIAVTDSVATALRMVKETERTTIVIGYVDARRESEAAKAFAERYPERVRAVDFIKGAPPSGMAIVPFLLALIGEKSHEGEEAKR